MVVPSQTTIVQSVGGQPVKGQMLVVKHFLLISANTLQVNVRVTLAVPQAALSKEKSERARIVLSLRDTITGLKQAGNVEGRLKTDLVNMHEQLAASRTAQVSTCLCYSSLTWLACSVNTAIPSALQNTPHAIGPSKSPC